MEDIFFIDTIKEGLTNTSIVVGVGEKKYVYRHPGEGTEAIISRSNEKKSLELAKSIGIDSTFIFMDDKEGWKISAYVEGIRIPDYNSFEDSMRVLSIMRKLHGEGITVDWEFLPWEEACRIEALIKSIKGKINDPEFDELKEKVKRCYSRCQKDGVEKCFCHCDTYAPNWMLTDKDTILIDWEYAGNADPGCDVGTYIMDAMWDVEDAIRFIKEYCGSDIDSAKIFHYLAYTAIVSFYWYVWALYREACGAVMGQSMHNWHNMAKRYTNYLISEYALSLSEEKVSDSI